MNLTTVRKSTVNEVLVGLLSFLIASISDTVNMVLLQRKKMREVNNFWYFFQEELASLLSVAKPFSGDLEG